jgi:hypothetical protein
MEAAGLAVQTGRENQAYRFISKHTLNACDRYGVTRLSVLVSKRS